MATGNIKGGKRNYARPTPLTATAALSGDDIQVTITNSALGPQVSSYSVIGTSSDGGAATTTTSSSSPVTITGQTPSKTYTFTVAGVNYNGSGTASSSTGSVTSVAGYELVSTVNATGNYTIPSGKTKLMAVVVGAGSAGGTPAAISGYSGVGGAGGSTGGIATIWNVSVTPSTTVALTIGAPGSSTIINYASVDLATVTSATVGNNNSGIPGAGGASSSNIATNRSLVNGTLGPGVDNRVTSTGVGVAGLAGTNVSFSSANIGIGGTAPATPLTFTLSTGASGGSGGHGNGASPTYAGGAGATGGTNGGNSGAGGLAAQPINVGVAGNAAANFGSGGGGGGGGSLNNGWQSNSAAGGAGGAGGSGRVYIFVK